MKTREITMVALALALPAEGWPQASVNPHVGYDVDVEEFVIGGSVQFGVPGAAIGGVALRFSPGFSYYLGGDGATFFVVDLDAQYPFNARNVEAYVGGGVWVRHVSVQAGLLGSVGDTDVGLNLKGAKPTARLEVSGSFNSMCSHRDRTSSVADVDAALLGWLQLAYEDA